MDKVTTHDMDELIINHDSWIDMDELWWTNYCTLIHPMLGGYSIEDF